MLTLATLLTGVVAIILATAPAAKAGEVPAICAQYPDLPQCENPAGGGGGNDGNPDGNGGGEPGAVPGGGEGPSANAGQGGELPFTGYPVTPLILLALLLLLLGLLVRTAIAVRDRVRARFADGSAPTG